MPVKTAPEQTPALAKAGWVASTKVHYALTLVGVKIVFSEGPLGIETLYVTQVKSDGEILERTVPANRVLLIAKRQDARGASTDLTYIHEEVSATIPLARPPENFKGFWKITRAGDAKVFFIPHHAAVFQPPTKTKKKHG